MFPLIVVLIASILFAFYASLAYQSLLLFSRSKLETYSIDRNATPRFEHILKEDERVQFSWLLLTVITATVLVSVVIWDFATPHGVLETEQPEVVTELEFVGITLVGILIAVIVQVVLPRAIARVAAESILFHTWPVIWAVHLAMKPMQMLNARFDTLIHRLAGVQNRDEEDAEMIAEEIRTVIDEGQREGVLESGATQMIARVMELQQEDVASVMTPRTDMVCISHETSVDQARAELLDAGHSRVPIIGESTDDILGILYAKDLLLKITENGNAPKTLVEIAREPLYVPETTGIDKLLETMKRDRVHIAIVLDEYGGVAGLVTMEDILEEIVGEITDEYDEEEQEQIKEVEPGIHDVDARVHIDDLNEMFSYELPEDGDYDTIGGFVFSQLGRIPKKNEQFTWEKLQITVLDADKRKLIKLRIKYDASLVIVAAEE